MSDPKQPAAAAFEICGTAISVDRSGCGYGWAAATADDVPANIVLEIECEMLDGGQDSCESFRASNGMYYRW